VAWSYLSRNAGKPYVAKTADGLWTAWDGHGGGWLGKSSHWRVAVALALGESLTAALNLVPEQ